jgi:hypothetical protein
MPIYTLEAPVYNYNMQLLSFESAELEADSFDDALKLRDRLGVVEVADGLSKVFWSRASIKEKEIV